MSKNVHEKSDKSIKEQINQESHANLGQLKPNIHINSAND